MLENPFTHILDELAELKSLIESLHKRFNEKEKADESDYIDTDKVCQLLGISHSTLYKYTCADNPPFPVYKVAKKLYFRHSEVLSYMEGGRLQSMEERKAKATIKPRNRSGWFAFGVGLIPIM